MTRPSSNIAPCLQPTLYFLFQLKSSNFKKIKGVVRVTVEICHSKIKKLVFSAKGKSLLLDASSCRRRCERGGIQDFCHGLWYKKSFVLVTGPVQQVFEWEDLKDKRVRWANYEGGGGGRNPGACFPG